MTEPSAEAFLPTMILVHDRRDDGSGGIEDGWEWHGSAMRQEKTTFSIVEWIDFNIFILFF
jgi:hypothetical protein